MKTQNLNVKRLIVFLHLAWLLGVWACDGKEECTKKQLDKMSNEIKAVAEAKAGKAHFMSNLNSCEVVDDEINTSESKSHFERTFHCYLVGKLIGYDRFVVTVKVEGVIYNCEDGKVLGAEITKDEKVY